MSRYVLLALDHRLEVLGENLIVESVLKHSPDSRHDVMASLSLSDAHHSILFCGREELIEH